MTLVTLAIVAGFAQASQFDIPGPPGSVRFGESVAVLSNGNIVVSDPAFDTGTLEQAGAVYLFNPAGVMISRLTGGSIGDRIGSGGVTLLGNGNFVVSSPGWDNGATTDVGAVTWINGNTGLTGVVAPGNSLIGTSADDQVGRARVTVLGNGNYVVGSPFWDSGAVVNAGAATWANGSAPLVGVVSSTNSLVGSSEEDRVADETIVVLTNHHYVVRCPTWNNGAIEDVGAVTWGNATSGVSGAITSAKSLIGSNANDRVGADVRNVGVTPLVNGNYVVSSVNWQNGAAASAGAVTWANGNSGRVGVVSALNSLVGTTAGDQVGEFAVTPLGNGNYVVSSPDWSDGPTPAVGAATWANGASGLTGAVTQANSLIGASAFDRVGSGITALRDGGYVVNSPDWDNAAMPGVGAVTWSDAAGVVGLVTTSNSLIGSQINDQVGNAGVTALSNGNYVAQSASWNNGVGAVTWGNGSTGLTGAVGISNSLIGTSANDHVGGSGVTALVNGNYVVSSLDWDNAGIVDVGATTWANGSIGITGAVAPGNSLIGTSAGDRAGFGGVVALGNGNYVVTSIDWDSGAATDAGAVTWADGSKGLVGVISPVNSLVGTTLGDRLGDFNVTALGNGEYVVASSQWDSGTVVNAGAVTWARGATGLIGTVLPATSVQGIAIDGGSSMTFAADIARDRLVVGQPQGNIVRVLVIRPDLMFANGFEN